jgi:ribosomal protein L37AE/L43A
VTVRMFDAKLVRSKLEDLCGSAFVWTHDTGGAKVWECDLCGAEAKDWEDVPHEHDCPVSVLREQLGGSP